MSLTSDQITAQNFKDFYGQIRPYLNGQVPTFANQFSRSDLYSTDEKIIGQWIDGKPLYQKTVDCGICQANAGKQVPHNISDIDCVRNIFGICIVPDDFGSVYNLPAINKQYPSSSVGVSANRTNIFLDNRNSPDSSVGTWVAIVTLQYTKTTDSAIKVGTGTDYSTDEQIIGTWIDGKPLYQKTVDTGTLPNATTKNIPHNISNIDKVVNIFGFSLSGTSTMPLPYTASNSDSKLSVQVTSSLVNISITCGTNRSNQTVSYVTLQYTKTTD